MCGEFGIDVNFGTTNCGDFEVASNVLKNLVSISILTPLIAGFRDGFKCVEEFGIDINFDTTDCRISRQLQMCGRIWYRYQFRHH